MMTVARLCRADQTAMLRRRDNMYHLVAAHGLSAEVEKFQRSRPFAADRSTLSGRVARLETGMAWAEDPPSRTRHMISNIEVASDTGAELTIHSNFIVYRSRAESEQDFYVGARQDLLRRTDGGLKIARRKLTLDQNVLLAKNLSIFF